MSSFNSKCRLITLSNTLRVLSWTHRMITKDQINRLNIAKNELLKIFGGFQIFKHALWQKMKTWKCQESTESFLNQKAPSINALPLLENC